MTAINTAISKAEPKPLITKPGYTPPANSRRAARRISETRLKENSLKVGDILGNNPKTPLSIKYHIIVLSAANTNAAQIELMSVFILPSRGNSLTMSNKRINVAEQFKNSRNAILVLLVGGTL